MCVCTIGVWGTWPIPKGAEAELVLGLIEFVLGVAPNSLGII